MTIFCPNCRAQSYDPNRVACQSCGASLISTLIPANLQELASTVWRMGLVSTIDIFERLWTRCSDDDKNLVINALAARAAERVKAGAADGELRGVLERLCKHVDSPAFFSEEAKAVISKAIAERIDAGLKGGNHSTSSSLAAAIFQDNVLISSIVVAAKKVADEYQPQLENLIRDRLAANLDKIVDDAVKEMAKQALENVQVKKS